MDQHTPGFGPVPLWVTPVGIGGAVLAIGVLALLSGSQRDGGIIALGAVVPVLWGLARLLRFRAATRRLRQRPPTADERTAIVLRALGADRADLAANAGATITPAQWRRIEAETGTLGLINGPLPAVQVAEGPAALSAHQIRNVIWYDLIIAGTRFRSTTDTIVNAMQRKTRYRVYYIDLPTPDRLRGTTRVILSAQGVADSPQALPADPLA